MALVYDVNNPYDSLQIVLLNNPGGAFFRGIHYWSAQLFLIFAIWHIIEHLTLATERRLSPGIWLRVILSIPFIIYVMLSGFILKGDSEGLLAREILAGLLNTLPLLGNAARFTILGESGDFQIIYLHHLATTTLIILLFSIEHARRFWPDWRSVIYIFSFSIVLSYAAMPSLHNGLNPVVKGPWYFLGLQEVLHWTSHPIWIPILTVLLLVLLYLLPRLPRRWSRRIKIGFLAVLVGYALLTIIGWLFRGANWQWLGWG